MLFLKSILLGGSFGLLYDALRITRIALPTARWVIFIEDVLFFLMSAVAAFFFLMRTIDGQVRFFIFIGILLGAVLYFWGLSVLIIGAGEVIVGAIRAILRVIYRWLLLPIWRIFYSFALILMRPVRFLGTNIKKIMQKCRFNLKVKRKVLYNQLIEGVSIKRQTNKQRKSKANVKKRARKKAQPKKLNI